MKAIGIDSGKKGCIVTLDSETHVATWLDLPWRDDGILHLGILNTKLQPYWSGMFYLEKIHGRAGWGATSVFNFGASYGQLLCWLYDKPHTLIAPKKWQYLAHIGASGNSAKNKSYQAFIRLNPSTHIPKKKDGLIDAFHIARFGLLFSGENFRDDWVFKEL